MVLYLAEGSQHFGRTEIFKEPSKFALSDYYEDHFIVPYQRIVLVTNKRVMLLQCLALDKMDKKPSKIMWDLPWEKLMAVELAKAGYPKPSYLLLHLRNFRRSENFVRGIKCNVEEEPEGREPQAVRICSVVRKLWKAYQSNVKPVVLKVPSSKKHVYFAWSEADGREPHTRHKTIVYSRKLSSLSSKSDEGRFVKHSINILKIWSSEQEAKGRCELCRKQVMEDDGICGIWRPICPDGYVSVGDVARVGNHPPNVAAVYRNIDGLFTTPVGYDLVWRNCLDDYKAPISIWHPRAPDGFVAPGCIAVAGFVETEPDLACCVAESFVEGTEFEEQKIWSCPDSYPWACHIYQVKSDALHFVALRRKKEESDWKPTRVVDQPLSATIIIQSSSVAVIIESSSVNDVSFLTVFDLLIDYTKKVNAIVNMISHRERLNLVPTRCCNHVLGRVLYLRTNVKRAAFFVQHKTMPEVPEDERELEPLWAEMCRALDKDASVGVI